MTWIVYLGPAERKAYQRGASVVEFERSSPIEVEDDFADELLALTDGHEFRLSDEEEVG